MDQENKSRHRNQEIPGDSTVIRQVPYAWLWSSTPWLVALAAMFFIGLAGLDDPIVGSVILLVIIVPRYFTWRRTLYILTDEELIYQRGGIFGSNRYNIPISALKDVRERYGFFGRSLGYLAVDLMLENGRTATLTYISPMAGVSKQLRELMGIAEPSEPDEDGGRDAPTQNPSSGD